MFHRVLLKTQHEEDTPATQTPHRVALHCCNLFPVADSLHQLSSLACKTQDAMVLDFKLSLNIRHTVDGATPAGPGILCATCISWRFILTSDKDAFESLAHDHVSPCSANSPSGSYAWLSTLVQPNCYEGVTAQCPVPS